MINIQTVLYCFRFIVIPEYKFASVRIANAFFFRRDMLDMVSSAARKVRGVFLTFC